MVREKKVYRSFVGAREERRGVKERRQGRARPKLLFFWGSSFAFS
jgi:hypothetical protein